MYQNNTFFIFKKLFLKSLHQNNLKTPKNINLKQKKYKKIQIFLKSLLKYKNKQISIALDQLGFTSIYPTIPVHKYA
jgi:hypothetical protein